jgi:hypothetical protein
VESLAGVSTAASDCRPVRFDWLTGFNPVDGLCERRQSASRLLRRHADRTAILREVRRLSLFLIGYFLKMLATLLSAVERGISPERRAVIDHDTTLCALSHDSDVHASNKCSVIVEKINICPSETLRDQDCALVGPQDQIDDLWIRYGDLSERALAVNRC